MDGKKTPAPLPGEVRHTDDIAVDEFASAMKAKLALKRADGRGGWDDPEECHIEFLAGLLHGHIQKGDPVDVGNIAMMLWHRGVRGNSDILRSDLTRRLAEVEDEKEKEARAVDALRNLCSEQRARAEAADVRLKELDAHYLAACQQRAQAEARVRELEAERDGWREQAQHCAVKRVDQEARLADLEAKDEERKAGWQLAGDAARGLRVECDGDLGHEAEQIRSERDALRERCEELLALRQRTEASA